MPGMMDPEKVIVEVSSVFYLRYRLVTSSFLSRFNTLPGQIICDHA